MAPGNTADEVRALRERVVQLENELVLHKLNGRRSGEDRFRFLMDSAPVMVRMTGGDGLCQYFNRAWLEFRGRTVEQEQGNGWAEGLHPDDHDLCMETYLKSFSARQPYRLEYRLRRRDGEYRWVEDTGVPRFEEDGLSRDSSARRWTPKRGSAVYSLRTKISRSPSGSDRCRC